MAEFHDIQALGGVTLRPAAPAELVAIARIAAPGAALDAGRADDLVRDGGGWVYVAGGLPFAAFGVTRLTPRRALAWAMFAERPQRQALGIVRATIAVLDAVAARGLHRVETTVRADDPRAQRFAYLCGFAPEGLMRRFGDDGADYWMMGRVRWPS